LAVSLLPWLDDLVLLHLSGWSALLAHVRNVPFERWAAYGRDLVRWLALHTGLPVLFVAAIVVAVSARILRRTARLLVEVVIVMVALAAASRLGWIRW
jgi:hypothetical protein